MPQRYVPVNAFAAFVMFTATVRPKLFVAAVANPTAAFVPEASSPDAKAFVAASAAPAASNELVAVARALFVADRMFAFAVRSRLFVAPKTVPFTVPTKLLVAASAAPKASNEFVAVVSRLFVAEKTSLEVITPPLKSRLIHLMTAVPPPEEILVMLITPYGANNILPSEVEPLIVPLKLFVLGISPVRHTDNPAI